MPTRPLLLIAVLAAGLVASCTAVTSATTEGNAPRWQSLFDGRTLHGWRPYAGKPLAGWEVLPDGTLHAIAKTKGGCELITEKKYDNFEFAWEWKLPPRGNNGVKYFVTEERTSAPGHEYQMLDDKRHPDGRAGPLRQTAAFYYVLPPAADKPYREAGEWNESRIVVRGNTVEHWLNGKNVLTYEAGSPEVKAGVAKSKFAKEPGFGDKIVGYIMLTYHQDDCWFRNLRIREL
jgi:hypothetical protein